MTEQKMRVWWIPQIPMKPFQVEVKDLVEAKKILDVLTDYDTFQFENNVKPDYCNAGGLEVWDENSDGEGTPDWVEWSNDDGYNIDEVDEEGNTSEEE